MGKMDNLCLEPLLYLKWSCARKKVICRSGSVFTNHSEEHSFSFSPRFCKFECNTTSRPYSIQSEVLLHSNAAKSGEQG